MADASDSPDTPRPRLLLAATRVSQFYDLLPNSNYLNRESVELWDSQLFGTGPYISYPSHPNPKLTLTTLKYLS